MSILRIIRAVYKRVLSSLQWRVIRPIVDIIMCWWARRGVSAIRTIEIIKDWRAQILYDYVEHPSIVRSLKKKGHIIPGHSSIYTSEITYAKDTLKGFDRTLLERFNFMQFSVSPQDTSYLVVKPHILGGFSSQILENLTVALIFGYIYNRTVIFDESLTYAFPFKPITNHAAVDTREEEGGTDNVFRFLPSSEKILRYSASTSDFKCMPVATLHSITIESSFFERLPYQYEYVTGLLLTSFLELQEQYRECIEKCKTEIGFPSSPVIGCHIRRGDISHRMSVNSGEEDDMACSIKCIEAMAEITPSKTVYIATDDPTVLKQLPTDSGINFIYDDREIRYNNHNAGMVAKNRDLRDQETMTAVKNIYLLGDCDYIIGSAAHFAFYGHAMSYYRNKKMGRIYLALERGRITARCRVTRYQEELQSALKRQGLPVKEYHVPPHGTHHNYREGYRHRRGVHE